MAALERNYLDKHDAVNRTARALTENGLSFIAAQNLHSSTYASRGQEPIAARILCAESHVNLSNSSMESEP